MPRPPRPWFRFYSESIDNRKVQSLPGDLFKLYVNLLCYANQATPRGQLGRLADIAFRLRVELQPLMDDMAELRRRGLLEGGWRDYRIHDWSDWQPDSDAQLTPGRKVRNHVGTPKERATSDVGTHRVEVEKELEGEKEKEGEGEGEADEPPAHPFSVLYSQRFRERTGKILTPAIHGRALSLEQKYGAEDCIQVAEVKGWDKDPSYYVGKLEDMKNGQQLQTAGRTFGPRNNGVDYDDLEARAARL